MAFISGPSCRRGTGERRGYTVGKTQIGELFFRDRFLRVIQNLVGNSVDALAPAGGTVRLSARRARDGFEISIRDDGPGIPEPIRKRVFEPFVTHGKQNGTGLGLAIAKSLVEAHGGKISLSTRTGQGTNVRIHLPHGKT